MRSMPIKFFPAGRPPSATPTLHQNRAVPKREAPTLVRLAPATKLKPKLHPLRAPGALPSEPSDPESSAPARFDPAGWLAFQLLGVIVFGQLPFVNRIKSRNELQQTFRIDGQVVDDVTGLPVAAGSVRFA